MEERRVTMAATKVIERCQAPEVGSAETERHATLMLADGTCIHGKGIGAPGMISGELVFTTAMTGYQEALTDPSYRGQILMFTYPLIGNYGVAAWRGQSNRVQARGTILATLSECWSECDSLRSYLLDAGVPVMYDVDTRAIAQWVREHGAMPAALSVHVPGAERPVADLASAIDSCDYDTADFVGEMTVNAPETHGHGSKHIALLDCGNKRSVIDRLLARDVQVVVLPARTTAEDVLRLAPDGLIISNGPGNPAAAGSIVETIRDLVDAVPIFGICLGHQLLALACGARTYKLKFGHRGANHPVLDRETGRAFVTTQNHGYAVDPASLPFDLTVSHVHLNDGTVEGLRHRTLPIRSVQFHPEGKPGPTDSSVVLDEWLGSL
jgi:carbamoyl-phosphate synthase small subunit